MKKPLIFNIVVKYVSNKPTQGILMVSNVALPIGLRYCCQAPMGETKEKQRNAFFTKKRSKPIYTQTRRLSLSLSLHQTSRNEVFDIQGGGGKNHLRSK